MARLPYPMAQRLDLVETLHGHAVADPYRWLEDPASAQTQEWLSGQQDVFSEYQSTWSLRPHFADRLGELLQPGGESAPIWRGERRFLIRRRGNQEHGVLLMAGADGVERVLLDPLELDPAGTTTLDSWQPSKEGRLLAYQVSAGGTEQSVLHVIDVDSGQIVDGPIERVRYSPIAWLPGEQAFYYVRRLAPDLVPQDETEFHRRVYLHRLGTPVDDDVEVFGHDRPITSYFGASVSRDGQWLIVSASDGTEPRNDVWLADLSRDSIESPQFVPVIVGEDANTTAMVGRNGLLYLFTDLDAPRGRLAVTDPHSPGVEHWVDVIAEDDEAVLDDVAFLDVVPSGDPRLLASWTRHAVSEVSVHELATGARLSEVALPGLGSVGPLVERPEGGHESWFTYTDYGTPPTVLRYDAAADSVSVWAAAPDVATAPKVFTSRLEAISADGTLVRAFVLSASQTPDAPRPTILYGYGGFGLSLTPAYSASALAWVEQGGVYVVASLRGGSEEGEQWHRDGMLGNKQRVYDDFYAIAEKLIADGWTTASQLNAQGGSNGGLLVGAALTQRPELFASIVCSAPLLDMVRYELFGLGRTWAPEYGTASDPEQFEWLYAYSPYHHVNEGVAYPSVLFTVFDGDSRVDPLHARKLTAALQYASTSDNPVLLRCERDVGHSSRSLTRSINLAADVLAYTAATTGMSGERPDTAIDEGAA